MKTVNETIYQRWRRVVQERGQAVALLGPEPAVKISYEQLHELVLAAAGGLLKLGLPPGARLAIYAHNSPAWAVIDLACNYLGIVTVPIHTTLAPELVSYILYDSGAAALVCDEPLLDKALTAGADQLPVIVWPAAPPRPDKKIYDWNHLLALGKGALLTERLHSSLCTIIYTSGTTGNPKGVCLTDQNILTDIDGALELLPMYATDRWCSFLPLSHALERTGGLYTPLLVGAQIAFARSIATLSEDLRRWQPTILVSVPRVFERAYEKILAAAQGKPLKRIIFHWAMKAAGWQKPLARWLVLKKIAAALGGRLRLAISGGATLNPHIAKFFKRVGLTIVEGYGLTETSPIISVNPFTDVRPGTVGKPIAPVKLTISDQKEILVSGANLGLGYWSREPLNQTADELTGHIRPFSPDGVLATGDLGYLDSHGYLTIIGRAKEIIVLPNGKKINPVDIEQRLELSDYIDQALVYLNKTTHLISALLVPSHQLLTAAAKLQGLNQLPDDVQELAAAAGAEPRLQELIKTDLAGRQHHLPEYEQVKHWQLTWPPFTEERAELTPTLKPRRGNILKRLDINH